MSDSPQLIREVEVHNYKSILEAKVELGRTNVLIGENGAGKSNFLEALALASAASQRKIGHEFLSIRGVRWVEANLMRSCFAKDGDEIRVRVEEQGGERAETWRLADPEPESGRQGLHAALDTMEVVQRASPLEHQRWVDLRDQLQLQLQLHADGAESGLPSGLMKQIYELTMGVVDRTKVEPLQGFLIFSPEYSPLRVFQDETQILPLGIRGEGLFGHLKRLSRLDDGAVLREISDQLDLIDWFDGFEVPNDLAPGERSLRLRDRYLVEQQVFDQRSANEGFLFLLFYFTLLISPQTPRFFAVDNVDASLNPKLCTALIRRMVQLAKTHDRQMILTTHNPAVLDGLDLSDDEQRLFVVSRDSKGRTRLRRVKQPTPIGDDPPVRLSEAFMNGYLGGLPSNF